MISLQAYFFKDSICPLDLIPLLLCIYRLCHLQSNIHRNIQNIEGLEFLHTLKKFVEDKFLEGDPLERTASKSVSSSSKNTVIKFSTPQSSRISSKD